jgi:hypothetical protein
MYMLFVGDGAKVGLDITKFIKLRFSWEAASCAATQEVPRILWNPKVHYRVHKSPPPVAILGQVNLVHTTPFYFSKINFNIVHLHTICSSSWSLYFWLSHQYPICIPLLPHSCYTHCPSHPPWLYHSNYTWRRVQVMKLLIMQFSPTESYVKEKKKSCPSRKQNPIRPARSLSLYQLNYPEHMQFNVIINLFSFTPLVLYNSYSLLVVTVSWANMAVQRRHVYRYVIIIKLPDSVPTFRVPKVPSNTVTFLP